MSYVRQRTWLENGPRRPGLGAWLDQQYCDSSLSLLDPVAWFACLPRDAANAYEYAQYGHIPLVGELPTPPAPNAPQTQQQMLNWTPEQSGITAAQWASYTQSQRDALTAAIAAGTWNPAGNLPTTADDLNKFFKDYGTYLLWGGIGLAAFVAFSVAKRSI